MAFERIIESPVGKLRLRASESGLIGLHFVDNLHVSKEPKSPFLCSQESGTEGLLSSESESTTSFLANSNAAKLLDEAERQLDEYFSGSRRRFALEALNLQPEGTKFQTQVWKELLNIPYGQTISYGELAKRIGNASAARAVGLANGRNPISVIVPCHRVIGSSGKLVGYGGGLDRKSKLLRIEGVQS